MIRRRELLKSLAGGVVATIPGSGRQGKKPRPRSPTGLHALLVSDKDLGSTLVAFFNCVKFAYEVTNEAEVVAVTSVCASGRCERCPLRLALGHCRPPAYRREQ